MDRCAIPVGVALLIALDGCGFQARAENAPPDAVTKASSSFCDPGDPHLMVCYEFEGDTRDSSSHHLDATMTNVTFPEGRVGAAMLSAANSTTDVRDSAVFDVSALTIEAWISPTQLPATGARAGIVDMNGQYGVFLHPGGDLTCTMVGAPAIPAAKVQVRTDRWTHVACTYDGATAAVIYVDGASVARATGGGTLGTGGTTGISIAADNPPGSGSRLVGLIDEVRLMSVARTPQEICADAQVSPCP